MAEPIFTVANQLTMLRLALVPLLLLLALAGEFTWALVVFVVAGLTDALDGYIARHGHQVTQLGAACWTPSPTRSWWGRPSPS